VTQWLSRGRSPRAEERLELLKKREFEVWTLAQKFLRVVVNDLFDNFGGVLALFHFERGLDDGKGIGDAPVAGGVHPDILQAEGFEDVDGAGGGALGLGVESQAGPVSLVEDEGHGVFFDVVDDDAPAIDVGVFECVEDEAGAF
jgi:hypothetical protein